MQVVAWERRRGLARASCRFASCFARFPGRPMSQSVISIAVLLYIISSFHHHHHTPRGECRYPEREEFRCHRIFERRTHKGYTDTPSGTELQSRRAQPRRRRPRESWWPHRNRTSKSSLSATAKTSKAILAVAVEAAAPAAAFVSAFGQRLLLRRGGSSEERPVHRPSAKLQSKQLL